MPDNPSLRVKHGFELPTQPARREVPAGETITVAELANRMAVKANEVIKAMLGMGVIANILVGIVGAGLGGWLAGQLGMGGGPAMSWVMAVVGAAILIALLKAIGVFK